MDMANSAEDRSVSAVVEVAAHRIARRYRDEDPARLVDYLESKASPMGEFLDIIIRAIEESELSRYEIAKRSGVSQATLSRLVNRQIADLELKTVEALCEVLGITLSAKKRRK
jgi:DNA-binding Xre family transcriptional regulator